MDLDHARNAKADIFRHVFGLEETPAIATGRTVPHFTMPAHMLERAEAAAAAVPMWSAFALPGKALPVEVAPPIAVGIAPPRAGKIQSGHSLVMLGTRKAYRDHPMVEAALASARGEARFIYTGPNRPFSYWSPALRRPLSPGSSIGHFRTTAGTLGAFVRKPGSNQPLLLSNNHVLAHVNRASIGDAIRQPGPADGGTDESADVATLHDFVPINFGSAVNLVDCALAALAHGVPYGLASMASGLADNIELTGTHPQGSMGQDAVYKVGGATGPTTGTIFSVETDNYLVKYGGKVARFDDQMILAGNGGNFSGPGDSGSLVVDTQGRARGLIFAGSARGGPSGFGLSAANPILSVFSALSVELIV